MPMAPANSASVNILRSHPADHSCQLEEAEAPGKSRFCGQLVKQLDDSPCLYRDRQICQRLPVDATFQSGNSLNGISAPLFRHGWLPSSLETGFETFDLAGSASAINLPSPSFRSWRAVLYDNGKAGLLNRAISYHATLRNRRVSRSSMKDFALAAGDVRIGAVSNAAQS